jgi:hypothetical protein
MSDADFAKQDLMLQIFEAEESDRAFEQGHFCDDHPRGHDHHSVGHRSPYFKGKPGKGFVNCPLLTLSGSVHIPGTHSFVLPPKKHHPSMLPAAIKNRAGRRQDGIKRDFTAPHHRGYVWETNKRTGETITLSRSALFAHRGDLPFGWDWSKGQWEVCKLPFLRC